MRIRTIKPEFFLHEQLAELQPLTRLLFIGLWCMADRDGRLEDRPKRIKATLMPYDQVDADEALSELANHPQHFIRRYSADGVDIIEIPSFKTHQRITGKENETESRFPKFNPDLHGETTGKQRGNNGETPEMTGRKEGRKEEEGKGREGKGKEGKELTYRDNTEAAIAPPIGFPKDEKEAVASAEMAGVPKEFAVQAYNIAVGRGFKDAKGHIITSWRHFAAGAWQTHRSIESEKSQRSRPQFNTKPGANFTKSEVFEGMP